MEAHTNITIAGYQRKRLTMIAQGVIRFVQASLFSVGLTVGAEKSCFNLFPGRQQQTLRLRLTIGGLPIRQANRAKFDGVTIDRKLIWRQVMESPVTPWYRA